MPFLQLFNNLYKGMGGGGGGWLFVQPCGEAYSFSLVGRGVFVQPSEERGICSD